MDYVLGLYPVSASRACKLFRINRSCLYYKKKMPVKDAEVKQLITEAIDARNVGRNKVIAKIRKQHNISDSRIRRVYTQAGFSLFKRMKRRRINNVANPVQVPLQANEEWAIDFMSDALCSGRRFRTLNMIDQHNRLCTGIYVGFNIPAVKLISELEQAIERHGKPSAIRTDNGPEFISHVFQNWLHDNKIKWVAIQRGKPQQNAIVERFNRTYREDILDANLHRNLTKVREATRDWIHYYNCERPHQALAYKTPSIHAK
jgi:putative transposase